MVSDTVIATAEPQDGSAPSETKATPSPSAAYLGMRRYRRGRLSPLTLRILAVNVLALGLLGLGLLYLGEYEASLIDTELNALKTQSEIFAAALGEGAVIDSFSEGELLAPELGRQMMRRLVEPTRTRARLFAADGTLVADTRMLRGPGGVVQIKELPPLGSENFIQRWSRAVYGWTRDLLSITERYRPYSERPVQKADDYPEVRQALAGESARSVRGDPEENGAVLSVAVPLQRYRQVLGAVMLSVDSDDIEKAVRSVRFEIVKVFLIVLAITVLLSIYLAGTIARPIRRLARAADRVRSGQARKAQIPDLTARRDEIGDLSGAMREMTNALWQRMDAIERFAADVAHEIKNPLTSLRSAVETAVRVDDPTKQRRLLAVVLEDVQRLDRLITDISDASRLDSEMSRIEPEPVMIGRMLDALTDLHSETAKEGAPTLTLQLPAALGTPEGDLVVVGVEDRLVQVFRNLIANAISFSPPGGSIRIAGRRDGEDIVVTIEDDGPGIPKGKLQAIFDRFYTERPVGEKFGTHSGLGLSISKQIVEAHRGAIRAENLIGAGGSVTGARFIVRLPIG